MILCLAESLNADPSSLFAGFGILHMGQCASVVYKFPSRNDNSLEDRSDRCITCMCGVARLVAVALTQVMTVLSLQ